MYDIHMISHMILFTYSYMILHMILCKADHILFLKVHLWFHTWFHISQIIQYSWNFIYDFTYGCIYDSHIFEQHMVRKYDLINRYSRPYHESYVVPYMIGLYMIECIWFHIWFKDIWFDIWFVSIPYMVAIYDLKSYMIWYNTIYDLNSSIYDLYSNHIWF